MKKLLALLILVALGFCLVATNPDKEDFVSRTKDRLAGGPQDALTRLGATVAAPALGAMTTVRDYVVCSVFETNVFGKRQTTLGILGNFIRLR